MIVARQATMNDLPSIMVFSRRACEASPTYGPMGFNSVIWRRTLISAFKDPTMRVFVSADGGDVCGILVGMIAPMPWSAGFSATDLVFAADHGGDLLLHLFIEWCERNRVRRIDMGVSDTGREQAKDAFFRRAGFSQAGRVYFRATEVK